METTDGILNVGIIYIYFLFLFERATDRRKGRNRDRDRQRVSHLLVPSPNDSSLIWSPYGLGFLPNMLIQNCFQLCLKKYSQLLLAATLSYSL